MKKLKTILQSNLTYIILFIFLCVFIIIKTIFIKYETKIKDNTTELVGIVTDLSITEDKISFTLKSSELIKCNYYIEELDINYKNLLGKKIKIKGKVKELYNNTIPNTFNYKKYLYNNYIYTSFTVSNIEIIDNENILYKIKNKIINRINNYDDNIKSYLNLFILGDKTYLDSDTYTNYRINGIWHLFAVSGMHISLIILVLDKLLQKIKFKNIIISLVLLYFMFLTDFSASVLRATIFFYLSTIFKYFNIKVSSIKILFLTAFIILVINPFMIYNIGFIYSFVITLSIMKMGDKITGNYFIKILKISILSFVVSIPITISINYEINILSILLNVFYVPFISLIVFPLSILTFICSFLSPILDILINILEVTSVFFNNLKINIIIPKIPIILIVFYYLILYLYSKTNKRKFWIYLGIVLIINIVIPKLDNNYYVYYLDVGQGDSSIWISPHKNEVIMLDTGGSINSDYHISNSSITFFKSLGITKIDLLILSHGDADHAKETLNLLENYQINNIILNNGGINRLEQDIINIGNVVNVYNSKYFNYQNILDYYNEDENFSSIITYLNIYNYEFLFMGDSPKEVENKLIKDYNFNNLDVLKVGHHGSKTSSSDEFIDTIKPKYSIISVGRNNIYGHPNKDVLENLEDTKIYRTDLDGSIMFKIQKDKMKIKTYAP